MSMAQSKGTCIGYKTRFRPDFTFFTEKIVTSILYFTLLIALIAPSASVDAKTARDRSKAVFAFERLNQTYQDITPEIGEINQGPLRIRLSSQKQVVVLKDHRLSVHPVEGHLYQAHLVVEFEGSGDLMADIDLAGLTGQLSDQFFIPFQKKEIQGTVKVERGEKGYHITPVKFPKQVVVEIRSKLVNRLIEWCGQFSLLPASLLDCGALDRSLTRLKIPIPQDQSYFLADESLTPEERSTLQKYFNGS